VFYHILSDSDIFTQRALEILKLGLVSGSFLILFAAFEADEYCDAKVTKAA